MDMSYLMLRGEVWWYNRRVPTKYAHLDKRRRVRISLDTYAREEACMLRDKLVEADNQFWRDSALAQSGIGSGSTAVQERYAGAVAKARLAGFEYRPVEEIARDTSLPETLDRLLAVRDLSPNDDALSKGTAEALLGGLAAPDVTVTEALEVYLRDISHNSQLYKSEGQRKSWEKVKRTSVSHFVSRIGNLKLDDITRDHALEYKSWWAEKISPKSAGVKPVAANTANRHIGNIRSLYSDYFKHVGDEERLNPFLNIHFLSKTLKEVPAFENKWVRNRLLISGAMTGLRADLQLIVFMLIETGCRPSEIINLAAEDIVLDHDVPHISIKSRASGKKKREVKTNASERVIPLVGVALEAASRAPLGFEHYHDRSELFSANMMKAFRRRDLFPTEDHRIYSFRHSFEKRMQEANIDYGLRCLLMGHKTDRPAYGDGGSLDYRRDELLKIAHPFPQGVFAAFDGEHG